MRRREFLYNGLAGACTLAFPKGSARKATSSVDSRIEILIGESLGTISPDIYGHFTENLGGVVYDGIWVGENSAFLQSTSTESA